MVRTHRLTARLLTAAASATIAVALAPAASAATPAATSSTSKIKDVGGVLSFDPSSVTGKVTTGTCSSTNYSFLVINTTKDNRVLIYQGQVLAKIKPNFETPICSTVALSGTITLKADPHAVLTFTVS